MLEVRDMRFAYSGGNRILDGVSFESAPGEVVAVLGNNGAGKSTLIKCMERILSPETGAVLVDGTDLLTLKRREHAKYAAYVPQEPPKGELTVFDAVGLHTHGIRQARLGRLPVHAPLISNDIPLSGEHLNMAGIDQTGKTVGIVEPADPAVEGTQVRQRLRVNRPRQPTQHVEYQDFSVQLAVYEAEVVHAAPPCLSM